MRGCTNSVSGLQVRHSTETSGCCNSYLCINGTSPEDTSDIKLFRKDDTNTPGNFVVTANDGVGSSTLVGSPDGKLEWSGSFTAEMVYKAVFNDYAEFFEKGEEVEGGDIVGLIGDEKYGKATKDSKVIVGVCSNEYAMIIGGDKGVEPKNQVNYIPVAMAGRVHVKVDTLPELGDYIIIGGTPGVGTPSRVKTESAVGQVVSVKDYDKTGRVRIKVI